MHHPRKGNQNMKDHYFLFQPTLRYNIFKIACLPSLICHMCTLSTSHMHFQLNFVKPFSEFVEWVITRETYSWQLLILQTSKTIVQSVVISACDLSTSAHLKMEDIFNRWKMRRNQNSQDTESSNCWDYAVALYSWVPAFQVPCCMKCWKSRISNSHER